jgi:molybdopterin molybdotransferase
VERVLSFEEARAEVERHAHLLLAVQHESEQVKLREARERVLAQPIHCDRNLPPFDRATRDGYAVRSADLASHPAHLRCIGSIKAGESCSTPLNEGECIEIMTGAPVPSGADSVVMVEYTRPEGERVFVERATTAGENVVAAGSEAQQGEVLLQPGTRLGYAEIATCASVGAASVQVYRKPRVAILCTGDELVPIEQQPGPAQIRNSNAHSLAAQVERAGATPVVLPIAPDDQQQLEQRMREGFECDLLLLSGGVSMGKYDLVELVFAKLGAEFFFTGAKIQPGKPVVFGRVSHRAAEVVATNEGKYFFGLPGNPVSTMVTFELFVRPLLDALSGCAPAPLRITAARLTAPVRTKTGLTRFLPASLKPGDSIYAPPQVTLANWQGSGDVVSIARTNAWLILPPDREQLDAGELATVLLR